MSAHGDRAIKRPPLRRLLRRGILESAATAIIALGIVMLCQPFWLDLYTYSFLTTLVGTTMYIVVTKFPD
jgi:hypothetical protein